MPDRNLEYRVAILEEDMQQFAEVPASLDAIDARITGVDVRLTGVEARLTGVETRLTGVETRLNGVESQIVQLRGDVQSECSAVRTEMRVLHEDAISRIALIIEAHAGARTVTRRTRRKKP
jgi:hypothetical protein